MTDRLPAHVEAAAIRRRAEAQGGFAAVLKKGDPDRGALTLILRCRGEVHGLLERELGPDFTYQWVFKKFPETAGSDSLDELVRKKARFDADFWLIELDIADPERFIAETMPPG
ncbi:DUF1491 family protein [Sphingomonas sp. SM33]|uniref:DUF1491 family protein n=1 Tax=Sphingomonas telluris TaxID=2907998 RepID=A0ABS9VPE6_9SPHN|nr:DUF1491 family protein [Sphingomonas telluris]MCH8616851.1 DUF1491 family protein [Sphingomonas telluris]